MTGVIPYPYRPNADMQYMTGIIQPGTVAVIQSNSRFILFYPDKDAWRTTWEGHHLNHEASLSFFQADEAYPMSEMASRVSTMMDAASSVALDAAVSDPLNKLPSYKSAASQGRVQSLKPLVHALRWIKSPAELQLMRRSAAIAAAAMADCMKNSHHGTSEHAIASLFEWQCKARGAQRMAYPSVVAGGPDACTIHYGNNDKKLNSGDFLLLDGGCEMHGYCSDVTRTWPVGGTFSSPQLAVYEAVLNAHKALLGACKPGTTLRQLHHMSIRLLSESLRALGVLPGMSTDAIMAEQAFRIFYPHSVGHWLGMDTHDSSGMSHETLLQPGVVLTIEPGLYIPDREEFGAYRGIGVRLEDDVAIVEGGAEVMSKDVPLEVRDVEELVGSVVAAS